MSKIIREARSEAKQLPAILGKTLGGLMAVVGFAGWVYSIPRGAEATLSAGFFLVGVLGIFIFIFCDRMLRSKGEVDASSLSHAESTIRSSISWLILITLSAFFILLAYLVTR
ncbi:hypothetical protein LCGC14_1860310 [marine sediment metagenome]|uniref:Uncharacterized protein n=1 Tax=marine sediment metagenome TaxID=412755 RepID=A0A0F9GW59_9ZZZZ